jgi:hypothetical protein
MVCSPFRGMNESIASLRLQGGRRAPAHRRRRPHSYDRPARYPLARYIDSAGPRATTLLALVREIQKRVENDADVVRLMRWMVDSGAISITERRF